MPIVASIAYPLTKYTHRGPAFFESFVVFPRSSRFIVDVNLGNNTIDIAENQIRAAIEHLGWERIFSLQCNSWFFPSFVNLRLINFQVGNEPDHFPGGSRPRGWSSADYTNQFLVCLTTIFGMFRIHLAYCFIELDRRTHR